MKIKILNESKQNLNESKQNLNENQIKQIISSVDDFINLTEINLSENNLTSEHILYLAEIIKKSPNLQILNLANSRLGDLEIKQLSPTIQESLNLEKIIFANNNFSHEGAKDLAKAIEKLDKLHFLSLGLNPIGFEGVKTILKSCQNLKNLSMLGLQWHLQKDEFLCEEKFQEEIVPILQKLKNLSILLIQPYRENHKVIIEIDSNNLIMFDCLKNHPGNILSYTNNYHEIKEIISKIVNGEEVDSEDILKYSSAIEYMLKNPESYSFLEIPKIEKLLIYEKILLAKLSQIDYEYIISYLNKIENSLEINLHTEKISISYQGELSSKIFIVENKLLDLAGLHEFLGDD